MKADAKHELDHADLGDFVGEMRVRDQPRRERSDHYAAEQVSEQQRQPQACGHQGTDQRRDEAERQGGNQRSFVIHTPGKN